MKNFARIQKRLILLIAFSIIWIFIGSLVIFHQEHVMGKTFKFNTISFIVPKSKDEKAAIKAKTEIPSDHSQNLILAILDDNTREQLLAGSFKLMPLNDDKRILPVFVNQSHSLRAPPLV
jgi:hypothetical protein